MFQKEFFHSDAIEEQFLVSQSEHFLKITFFSLCEEHFKHQKKKENYKEYFVEWNSSMALNNLCTLLTLQKLYNIWCQKRTQIELVIHMRI